MNRIARVAHVEPGTQRCGITLVEMLVAMTVSLIMIYGLLHAFANMITYVNDGRAAVEISSQLRGASHRLQDDLRQISTSVRAWPARIASPGYFEYIEGLGHDTDPLLEYTGTPISNTSFGDFDDVLAMTISTRGHPFVGQVIFQSNSGPVATTLDAPYAEVVWWCVWADADADLQPGVNEVTLYRRVLLVRPDIAPWDGTTTGLVWQRTVSDDQTGYINLWDELELFYDNNDISVRPLITRANNQLTVQMWANSLADLTRRENRFCHRRILVADVTTNPIQIQSPVDDTQLQSLYPFEMVRFSPVGTQVMPSLTTVVQRADQLGEDVMQSHVLAFDIKGFDPNAPLLASSGTGEVLAPHDPGFLNQMNNNTVPVGAGAFVDLFYMNYVSARQNATTVASNWNPPAVVTTVYPNTGYTSAFSAPPAFFDESPYDGVLNLGGNNMPTEAYRGVGTPTYDTWTFQYEQDGVDQDWIALLKFYGQANNIPQEFQWRNGADQGMDGFDNDGANGVDDPNERETAPPYAAPLRGVRISLRVNEPDSRQVRQMTVVQDFTPE